MGKVTAVCTSDRKGVQKTPGESARFVAEHGIEGNAHAGAWHRQVSLISAERVEEFRARGADVGPGAFEENLIVSGIDFRTLPVGTLLRCGDVILEMTQIGKECHNHCAIRQKNGRLHHAARGHICARSEGRHNRRGRRDIGWGVILIKTPRQIYDR